MNEAHPYVPFFLAFLALLFCAAIGYMVLYDRRQKAKLKELEREGHPAHSLDEGILLAQERSQTKHAHPKHEA